MIRFLLIISLAASSVLNAPTDDRDAKILVYENNNDGSGNYHFRYETSNGLSREETGRLVNAGQTDEHVEVSGSYSYTDIDGNLKLVFYTADKNGYRITSEATLPQFMPIFKPEQVEFGLPASAVATLLGG